MKLDFIHNIPLEDTMHFEAFFEGALGMNLSEKKELREAGAEFIY